MRLKTYTPATRGSYAWVTDREFIWRISSCGSTEWFQHSGGLTKGGLDVVWAHRLDGPAVMWDTGLSYWWVRGEEIHSWVQFRVASDCSDEEIIILKLKWGIMEASIPH